MGKLAGVNLTKAKVESLTPKTAMYRVPDTEVRGLNIQVTPAGVLSWVLRFRIHGHQKAHTLGRWPELTVTLARKRALSLLADIGGGNDPVSQKKEERKAKTMNDLASQFRKEHLPTLRPNSQIQYERLLTRRILPALGSKRLKDIDPADVAALLSQIRSDTPKGIEANRTRAVLSKMFSMGALWGFCPAGSNPAKGQARAPEIKRERHFSDRELVALGAALRHLEPTAEGEERPEDALPPESLHALAALRLYLLTGLRKSELIGDKAKDKVTREIIEKVPAMPWSSVDLVDAKIQLVVHKTSKKAGTRTVYLCPSACEILEALPRMLGNPYVIPGYEAGEALVGLPKIWGRVREAVPKLEAMNKVPKKNRVDVSDVILHDFRRSFSSLALRMGYPELIEAALLGHSAKGVTAGYARISGDPLRTIAEDIGERMAALLAGTVDLEAEVKTAKDQAQVRRMKAKGQALVPGHSEETA